MAFQVADWVIPLFFLAALAILAKYRRQIQSEDKESFKYISSGLVLLALVSVSRILFLNGYFVETPFLSDPLFYRIASWIVIITGAAFIISGLATWLPVANQTRRHLVARMTRLELLKKIENLIAIESRPGHLFSGALDYMMEHHQFKLAIAFRYSASRNMLFESGFLPESINSKHELRGLTINTAALQQLLNDGGAQPSELFRGLPDQFGTPDFTLPVVVQGRAVGFFVLWGYQRSSLTLEDLLNLRIACDMISHKIEIECLRRHNRHLARSVEIHGELQQLSIRAGIQSDRIASVLRTMRQGVMAEAAFLWQLAIGNEFCTRFSIGLNGSLLQEKGLPISEELQTASQRSDADRASIVRINVPGESKELSALSGPGYSNAIIMTVAGAGGERFVMVLATSTTDFDSKTLALVNQHKSTVAHLLQTNRVKSDSDIDSAVDKLDTIWDDYRQTGSLVDLLDQTSKFCCSMPGVNTVRISTTESSGRYLVSRTLASMDGKKPVIGRLGMMDLSLMPLHRAALVSGKAMLASTSGADPVFSIDERNQAFSESVPSLAILPFGPLGSPDGVITLGMAQHDQALSSESISMVRLVSHYLSLVLNPLSQNLDHQSDWNRPDRAVHEDLAFKSRMKSSLSGIFGSVELLKAKQETEDPQIERYLGIIDKSARRMSQYLEPNIHEKSVL